MAESHAYGQALRAVDQALTHMPQRMRDVFIAHRLEGVPHDELAQRYQVSRKTIEREITKAMDIAQTALAGETNRQGRRKTIGALLDPADTVAPWRSGAAQSLPAQRLRGSSPGRCRVAGAGASQHRSQHPVVARPAGGVAGPRGRGG